MEARLELRATELLLGVTHGPVFLLCPWASSGSKEGWVWEPTKDPCLVASGFTSLFSPLDPHRLAAAPFLTLKVPSP